MKVTDSSADAFWKGEIRIQGTVEEDNESYKAKVYLKGSQVFDYSCSCAGGSSRQGLCPHCKALLEEFRKNGSADGNRYVSTSQSVRLMIREYTNREVARIMGEEETGQVRLVPKLLIGRQGVRLECRIGKDKLYQIKDLSAFSLAMETGQRVEYGKGLAFNHCLEAFDGDSKPVVRLVTEIAGAYKESYEQLRRGNAGAPPSFRSLTLNRTGCDRFFEIVCDKAVEVVDLRGQEKKLLAFDENPPVVIVVEQEGKDGINVSISNELMAFQGENHLYVADQAAIYRCDIQHTEALSIFLNQLINAPGAAYQVSVNKRDIPLFYERVLKKLEQLGLIQEEGMELDSLKPEELNVRFEFDSDGPNQVSLEPQLSYGTFSFHPLEDENVPNFVCRDVPNEFRVSQLITKYFKYKEGGSKNLIIRGDEEAIYHLLDEGMEQFAALGDVYLSNSFRELKVLPKPRISMGVSLNGGWLDLSVDAGGLSSAELYKALSEYTKKKKYYRLKTGEFLRLNDDGLLTVAKLFNGLAIGKAELQSGKIHLPGYRALYVDHVMKEDGRITFERNSRFRSVVRGMKSVEDSSYEIPPTLNGTLRKYQKIGFRWLKTLDEYRFGGILADDMGLGKTVQMISLLLDYASGQDADTPPNERTSLIVCPASLVYNWSHEFSVFAPSLNVLPVAGTLRERKESLEHMEQYDVVITSYDLLKRDFALYAEKQFRYEVLDEAQYIKNASTQSARAVKSIQAVTRFALTGTPVENRLGELWSIFDFLMPGFLFSYRKFKTVFEIPIVKDGDREVLEELHRMIKPFVLRRLKSDVLKELPEKLEKVVYSALSGKQKELYTANALQLKKSLEREKSEGDGPEGVQSGIDGSGKLQILSELTRLRQICCDPALCYENREIGSAKLETCVALLSGAVSAGHKVLLFSQFASMLEIIGKRLEAEGISFYKLTGATPKEERNHLVNAFQQDPTPVFLISLKAGGTGLNLTAADMVIHYDPWWNVAAQNQATDRAHRIGQQRQVTVYKLIMKQTIEENIMKLQDTKRDLADQIVTEGMVSLGSLGRDELLRILG